MATAKTSTKKFNSLSDLEAYINQNDPKKDTGQEKKDNVKQEKLTKEQQEQKSQQQILEDMVADVKKKTTQKADFVSLPTYFKKPVFFLDQLTPFLEVSLIFRYDTSDNPKKPYEERRVKLFSGSGEEASANHLVYFKYIPAMAGGNTGGGAGSPQSVEIRFVDIKNEILDYLAYQLFIMGYKDANTNSEAQLPVLEVEYGWVHNDKFKPSDIKDWDKIAFTSKFTATVNNVIPTYNSLGIPEVTIHGTTECDEVILKGNKPWDLLSNLPATALALKEMFYIMEQVFNKIKGNSAQLTAGLSYLAYVISLRGAQDSKVITEILKAACAYYGVVALDNSIQTAVNARISNSNAKFLGGKINFLPEILGVTDSAGNLLVDNLSMGSSNLVGGGIAGGGIGNNYKTRFQELYHVTFRNLLDKELVGSNKLFTNLFTILGTAVYNTFKIHPYLVFRYFQNVMKTTLNEDGKQTAVYYEVYDFMVSPKNLMPIDFDFLHPQHFPNFNDKTQKATLEYYVNVKDYKIDLGTKWADLYQSVISKMYIHYDLAANENPTQSLAMSNPPQVQTSANQKVKFVPLRLNSCLLMCDPRSAKSNLELFKYALEQRKKFIQQTSKGNKIASPITKDTFTDQNIKDVNQKLGLINNDAVYLLHMICISGNPSDVFMTNLGQQMIAQAYSFRVNDLAGINDQFFSIGEPNVYNINVMDIQSVSFDFNYYHDINSIAMNARLVGGHRRGEMVVENYIKKQVKSLLKQAEDSVANGGVNLTTLKSIRDQIKQIDPNAKTSSAVGPAHSGTYPINVTISDYQSSRMYSGDLYNALEKKRTIQNIRNEMILVGRQVKCTLTVLGDPSFNSNNITNYKIFLKMLNQDGSLSIFTGLYQILQITHEIQAGKFITTINAQIDSSSNEDFQTKEQLRRLIYASDRQKPSFDY